MPVRVRVLVHRRCHLARSVRRDLTGALEEVPTEVQPRLTRAHHVDLFGRALADVTDPHVTGRCVDREPPRVPQTFRPELRSHVGLPDERVVGGDVVAGLGQLRLDAQDRAEQLRHVLGVSGPCSRPRRPARRTGCPTASKSSCPPLCPRPGCSWVRTSRRDAASTTPFCVRVRDDVRRAVPVVEVQEHAAVARVERDAEQALFRAVLELGDLSAQIEDLGRHAVHDPVDASGLGGHVSGRVACLPCHRGRLADVAVHRRQPDRDRFERRDGGRRRQRGGRCRRRGRRGRRRRRRRGRRGRRGSRRVVVSSARAGGEDQRDARCRDPVPMCVHAALMRSAPRSCCRCRADLARTIPGAALQSDVPNWGIRRCRRSENLRGRMSVDTGANSR